MRPWSLTISLSPVLAGSVVAWNKHATLLWLPMLCAIVGACLIQIGTNLFNDVGDFQRGADQPDRLGPPRATSQGWLTAKEVITGAWIAFALAFLCGIYLVWHGGWPIVAIGLFSLAAGWSYTCGPRPIAYHALGECFVVLFFGLAAVGGSYYLQTLSVDATALVVALQVGLLAAAVITVNNYRDLDSDTRYHKRTLAVVLGRPATRWLYAAEMLLPYLLLAPLAPRLGWGAALPVLSLPIAVKTVRSFWRETPSPAFNRLLGATARLQLIFVLLLGVAFVLRAIA